LKIASRFIIKKKQSEHIVNNAKKMTRKKTIDDD